MPRTPPGWIRRSPCRETPDEQDSEYARHPHRAHGRASPQATGEDEATWVKFFELYQPVIRHFAEFAGARSDTDDVVQDVMVKLVEVFRSGTYHPEKGRFRAFLATITRREVINRWQEILPQMLAEDPAKRPLDLEKLATRLTSPPVAPGPRLFARPWVCAAGIAAALGVAAGAYFLLLPSGKRTARPAQTTVQAEDVAWLDQAFAVPGDAR